MYLIYLLQSECDQTYYIGYTHNIKNRINYHNNGRVKSTKRKRPWKLIGFEEKENEQEARWREYTLKHNAHERYKYIQKLTRAHSSVGRAEGF